MAIDKYTRRSQKSLLGARRRNNTAGFQLDHQLKYLERNHILGNKQYKRDVLRIQGELKELECIPTSSKEREGGDDHIFRSQSQQAVYTTKEKAKNANLASREHSEHKLALSFHERENQTHGMNDLLGLSVGADSDLVKTSRQLVKSCVHADVDKEAHRSMTGFSHPSTLSSINSSPVPRTRSFHSARQKRGQSSFVTSTPNTLKEYGKHHDRRTVTSSAIVRSVHSDPALSDKPNYCSGRQADACQFFPCSLPATYHTLGFRRQDLCPWQDGCRDEKAEDQDDEDKIFGREINSQVPREKAADKGSKAKQSATQNHYKEAPVKSFNTSWIKTGKDEDPFKFKPKIQGPAFGPAPVDPVLERIRKGLVEPKIDAGHAAARVSIRDRIRGLQQLVQEMRSKIDMSRPREWAVNYGQRVTTRVLQKTLVPVSASQMKGS